MNPSFVASDRFLFFDGGLGTMLLRSSSQPEQPPFLMSLTQPDAVLAVHQAYVDAGSDIICSNTFGLSRRKLAAKDQTVAQIVTTAVEIAKKAAAGRAKVALDIGPLGELMQPFGPLSFESAYDAFREMAVAGEKAGADLVAVETMASLTELRAAVLAVRENTSLPVFATMTFEASGRTFLGTSAECFAMVAEGLGVCALGVNCSLEPQALVETVKTLSRTTSLPLIIKPNAGMPDAATGAYSLSASDFASQMEELLPLGVHVMGGCCGTDPSFIRTLRQRFAEGKPVRTKPVDRTAICTDASVLVLDESVPMGTSMLEEKNQAFRDAVASQNIAAVMGLFSEETDAGAAMVCVPAEFETEAEQASFVDILAQLQSFQPVHMAFVVETPGCLTAALRAYQGKACVLAQAEADMDALFEIIVKYGAVLMGIQA